MKGDKSPPLGWNGAVVGALRSPQRRDRLVWKLAILTSYRSKLQAAFLGLACCAVLLTGWQAMQGATGALRDATFDRLAAVRQTRCRELERYFQDLESHVLALASDESSIRALEEFSAAWAALPGASSAETDALRAYYRDTRVEESWMPRDARAITLQHQYLVANPHRTGAKDRLLAGPGRFGEVHRRYHPTLLRYQSAFGFYDILLIDAATSRVLYSVMKETDLGQNLADEGHRDSPLAAVFREALQVPEPERAVVRDYTRYVPSHGAPAAFLAAPVWRGGEKIGVLAIQISTAEIDRVMSGEREGLGQTGQAYLIGSDGFLRSDLGGGVLGVQADPDIVALVRQAEGTEIGRAIRPKRDPVLRSHARTRIPGLDWMVVVEIAEEEAFAPVRELRSRILLAGLPIVIGVLIAAAVLARSVTVPVLRLQGSVRRLAKRDFRVQVDSGGARDELGELAEAFNNMARDLEKTTVSKEELEKLAGRLITAQEEERSRIARELHDDLTQRMAAVAIEAGNLAQSDPSADWRSGVRVLREKIAKLADDIHGLSRSLHPGMLDDLGLAACVEAECRASFERGGPPVESSIEGEFEDLPAGVRLTLLRIVQEGLRNIQRHAAAEEVRLQLKRDSDGVLLTIADDGRGFTRDDPQWRPGLGLASMEERARFAGGQFEVASAPGQGTRLTVRIPQHAG